MSSGSVRKQTPEEQELERKLAELTAVEAELAQGELNLATLQAELNTFEREYLQVVGIRYTELDRIEAQIVEYMTYLESSRNFKPSENLKKLYREVAKRIHPDLATDEAERSHRQQLMVEVNQAYEDGDEKKLQTILQNWESSPESVKGGGVAAELIRVIRKIAQGRDRLKEIENEIELLKQTDLHQLKTQVMSAKQAGLDLLATIAAQLDEQIAAATKNLENLKSRGHSQTQCPNTDIVQSSQQPKSQIPQRSAESFCKEGLYKFNKGNNQGTIKDFARTLQIDPNNLIAHNYRQGSTRYLSKDYLGAVEDFTQVIQLDPTNANAYKRRGLAHYKLDFYQKATKDLLEAAKLYANEGNVAYSQQILDILKQYQQ